jgi:hypothetical protein
LAGRLGKLVRIANQRSASELAEFFHLRCSKIAINIAIKAAKVAKRSWRAALAAGFPFWSQHG